MMTGGVADRYRRWGVDVLLESHPDLRIIPTVDESLKVGGVLRFRVRGPRQQYIEDEYSVEMRFPAEFPAEFPSVFETGGRIPEDFHKLEDGSFCLAAPTAIKLGLNAGMTLAQFVEAFVVPYLFSFSSFERTGSMPYGELEHGKEGLRQHFATLFGVDDRVVALEFVRLTSLKKRRANKVACPCGSGRRLGRCHNRTVNGLREKLGRGWFAQCYAHLGSKEQRPRRIPSSEPLTRPLVSASS